MAFSNSRTVPGQSEAIGRRVAFSVISRFGSSGLLTFSRNAVTSKSYGSFVREVEAIDLQHIRVQVAIGG